MEQTTFKIDDIHLFKKKALTWANSFDVVCALDSNEYKHDKHSSYEFLLAVDALQVISCEAGIFEALDAYRKHRQQWLFGYFSYDIKNEIEALSSSHKDGLKFPSSYFFEPRYLISIDKEQKVSINRNYPEAFAIFESINNIELREEADQPNIILKSTLEKEEYLNIIQKIKWHIEEGDIYEMNFCRELYNEHATISPIAVFMQLNDIAKAPFSSYFKSNEHYILCASPERFLQKKQDKLISQPIKGTIRRGASYEEDELLKSELYHSEKERAENIMIVDLVRNDLTHFAQTGSIHVDELFGIYSFTSVHHMISTISARLKNEADAVAAIKKAFPMGSMTGAPKIRAMQLIEDYEKSKRGVFSSALGYFNPENNFDFNVVIRSILYNQKNQYLSIQSGGAITIDSVPESEWDELQLKSSSLEKILQ